jgi:hypothetical protein
VAVQPTLNINLNYLLPADDYDYYFMIINLTLISTRPTHYFS